MDVMAKSRDAIGRDGRSDGDELDRFGVHLILPRALKQIPSDLVVRYQAIDIVGVILSFIW
jgi:hypothetical protein